MGNLKKVLETVKVLWSDARGRALIKLGLYIVFLAFVFIYIKELYRNAEPIKKALTTNEILEQYSNKENYMSKYSIGDKEYRYLKNQKQMVVISGVTYYIEEDRLFDSRTNTIVDYSEFPFWTFTPNYINELILSGEELYSKNYKDGTKEISYLVSLSRYLDKDEDNSLLKDKNIEIVITIKEEKITKTSIDLKDYYAYIGDTNTNSLINIEYE